VRDRVVVELVPAGDRLPDDGEREEREEDEREKASPAAISAGGGRT